VKTQSLFWNAFQLNSKTDDGYRVQSDELNTSPNEAKRQQVSHRQHEDRRSQVNNTTPLRAKELLAKPPTIY